jgi:hypothetical protein
MNVLYLMHITRIWQIDMCRQSVRQPLLYYMAKTFLRQASYVVDCRNATPNVKTGEKNQISF